jgi:hypothetical protein
VQHGQRRPGPGGAVWGWAWSGRQHKETWRQRWRAWKRCEREKREKERAGLGTIPAYVRRADTSANEHKWLAYVAVVAPYVRRPPDEHMLRTLV